MSCKNSKNFYIMFFLFSFLIILCIGMGDSYYYVILIYICFFLCKNVYINCNLMGYLLLCRYYKLYEDGMKIMEILMFIK